MSSTCSRFEALQPQSVNGAPRFTSTVTLLIRNPRTKSLTPVAILVSGLQGKRPPAVQESDGHRGGLALRLAGGEASITVFGVWLGHVYHWHLVAAAMQMAMFKTLPTKHPIYQLLAPQSKYAIPFDDVLLSLWSEIARPTSLATANDFLALADGYATGRSYLNDDPKTTMSRLGLRRRDFTVKTPRDRYPVVQRLLTVWDLVEAYVETFVRTTYRTDAAVAADGNLQTWIATASSSDAAAGGNIRGLPTMNSRGALRRVLTSLLSNHGARNFASELDLEPRPHLRSQLPSLPSAHRHPEPARSDPHQSPAQLPTEHRHDQPVSHLLFHLRLLSPIRTVHPARRRRQRPLLSWRATWQTQSGVDPPPEGSRELSSTTTSPTCPSAFSGRATSRHERIDALIAVVHGSRRVARP
jgi:Lipoxygenase